MHIRHIQTSALIVFLALIASSASATSFTELPTAFTGLRFCAQAWGDYDNDGDMDLAMAGSTGAGNLAKIYRNDGSATFTDTNASITGVSNCSVAWGDYDNDGDLDLAVAGFDGTNPTAKIYRNDSGTFTDAAAGLSGVTNCSLAWADCDNDGDLDLAIAGGSGTSSSTKIYRNDGKGKLADSGVSLTGVTNAALAWGDYDNDGDLDLAVAGLAGSVYTSKIYKNDGNGQFTDANAGLVGLKSCSLAWGDYDNDGDLDLAASGAMTGGYSSVIYRNDSGKMVDIRAGIDPSANCSVAWGDMDSDGDLDLLLTGWSSTAGRSTKVFRNDGTDKFTNANAVLPGLEYSSIALADWDNDGDLDIALAGYAGSNVCLASIFSNGASSNTVPDPPAALTASVSGSSVQFAWSVGHDSQTAAPGLSYNLRVGTSPGNDDVFRGVSDAITGRRRIPATGNTQKKMAWTLKGLAPSQYYWSVQSIDTSFAGSQWAGEKTVTVPSVKISGYIRSAGGVGLQGVTVTPDNSGHPSTTDASGYYEIRVVKGWSGGVSPSMSLYSFGPSRTTYTNVQADQSNQNYTATPYPRISGRIKTAAGDGLEGVTLTPSSGTTTAKSGDDGTYSLAVTPGWSGTVAPSKTAYTFSPSNLTFANVTTDAASQDFTATPYPKICGTVKTSLGTPVEGVTLATGSSGNTASTDANGYYELSVASGWSGSVSITKSLYTFNPTTRPYADVKATQTAQDYTAFPYPKISGTVRTSAGSGASGVSVIASNGGPTATTDGGGHYSLDVTPGWSGIVTPSLGLCTFTPSSQTYSSISADHPNQDFSADRFFTDIGGQLTGVRDYAIAWGDYDNDGDLDLAIGGTGSSQAVTRIYRNDDGTFVDTNADIVSVSRCSLAWGDCDNDGDLDLAVVGLTALGQRTAKLYRNDLHEVFTDIGAGLTGVAGGAVAWGDYDNDGFLDLAIAGGAADSDIGSAKIYRNQHNGTFSDIAANLPAVTNPSLAWADYDNDGDLDLALAGDTGSGFVTNIYRNNGDGTFTSAVTGLAGLSPCSLAWGDYDNDGYVDLAMTGSLATSSVTKVYRNNGSGSFADTNLIFPVVNKGAVSWGDLDNDGDLDLALTGQPTSGSVTARLYRNDSGRFTEVAVPPVYSSFGPIAFGDYDNDGDLDFAMSAEHFNESGPSDLRCHVFRNDGFVSNTPPLPPTGLTLTRDDETLTFGWSAAVDIQTPTSGLCYNVRAGTRPGGNDVFSGMASPTTGLRSLPAAGNAQSRLSWTINAPQSTRLFWSVQAIDTSFAASSWAPDYAISPLPNLVRLPDGARVETTGIISAVFNDCYYMQCEDHPTGIKIVASGYNLAAGTRVSVVGSVSADSNGERCIVADSVKPQ